MLNKPSYYWDETQGLKDDKPLLVKLVATQHQRQTMPSKCPSVFGVTVGYTHPVNETSQQVLWRVIPANMELRESVLVFIPTSPTGIVKKSAPQAAASNSDEQKTHKDEKQQATLENPSIDEALPSRDTPTYEVVYLGRDAKGKYHPALRIGVTFMTQHHNHRMVWDVLPSSEALATGVLILNPYDAEDEETAKPSSWLSKWQR
ncbi:MAG: hypothetical protein AAFR81_29405 [Chloroflexota bacterium]